MEIIYKANDGKEFSSLEECEAYENAQNALFSIKFYYTRDENYEHTESAFKKGEGFNATSYSLLTYSSLDSFSDCYQRCSIIYIPSAQALRAFENWKNDSAKQDKGELMVGFNFWYYDPNLENSHWVSSYSYLQWLKNEEIKVREWIYENNREIELRDQIEEMRLRDQTYENGERPQEYSAPLINVPTS